MIGASLRERCAADLSAVASPGTDANAPAARLLARYDEPGRHYHTRTHLAEMLWALEELDHELEAGCDRSADEWLDARLTVWFHDAVYDPHAAAGRNERDSAALASDMLRALGAPSARSGAVQALVLATADHRSVRSDRLRDAADAVLDADLWILAAPADRFDEYCAQVRAEYGFVGDATYRAARSAILHDLAGRARLYATGPAHRAWTAAARRNVARELARLQT